MRAVWAGLVWAGWDGCGWGWGGWVGGWERGGRGVARCGLSTAVIGGPLLRKERAATGCEQGT
jgi:hypothetical protein